MTTFYRTPVTGPQFLRKAGLAFGAMGVLCAAVGFGLWKERSWTRPLMVMFWIILDTFLIVEAVKNPGDSGGLATAVFFAIVYNGEASWYLYGRRAVAEYYAAIDLSERARAAQSPDGA